MKQAINNFETIQQASNIKWLQQQVLACQGLDPVVNDLDKRGDELKICGKHTFWSWRTTHLIILEERKETLAKNLHFASWEALASHHNITSVDELLSVNIGQHDKGTKPPLPLAQQSIFLKELHTAIIADFDSDAPSYTIINLPSDYAILLNHTDGLADTDLRNSHECGISSITSANIDRITGYTPYNEQRGLYRTDNLPWCNGLENYGWQVSTGFILGGLSYREDRNWLAYYYCCRVDPSAPNLTSHPNHHSTIKDNEGEWKWRVFYNQKGRFQHSFSNPLIFNDLVEWMEFHGNWWERESVDYPAWEEKCIADVELMYGARADDGSEDEEEEEELEVNYDGDMLFET
jgi:hypothetical protein